jgi:hypothetical protein
LLCAVAHFVGVAHFVLVEHVHCAQHGELAHATGHDSHRTEHAPAPDAGGVSVAANDVSAERGHDHCLALSDRREVTLAAPAAIVAVVPCEERAGQHAPLREQAPDSDVYRWAPKTSPPT